VEPPRNPGRFTQKAVEWFQKAADQGVASAQYNLGMSYELGVGVEKDIPKAKELYKKAIAQGHQKAQQRLNNLP